MAPHRPRTALPPAMLEAPISVTSALRIGVGRERLRGRDLDAPFHGIRAPTPPADVAEAARAYATRMPRWAAFSGRTAAQLMGAPLPARMRDVLPLEVVVPSGERAIRRRGIISCSATFFAEPRELDGLRVCSPEDLWCGFAERLHLRELVALGDHLIHRTAPWTDRAALQEAASRIRRGAPVLRDALDLLDDRAESSPESEVRVVLVLAGIPDLVPNLEVVVDGRLFRLDLALPWCKVAIEYQGDYHRNRDQWRRDMSRRQALEAAGWIVIELNADDLRHPDRIVALVRGAIARASR